MFTVKSVRLCPYTLDEFQDKVAEKAAERGYGSIPERFNRKREDLLYECGVDVFNEMSSSIEAVPVNEVTVPLMVRRKIYAVKRDNLGSKKWPRLVTRVVGDYFMLTVDGDGLKTYRDMDGGVIFREESE